jgi:ABC-type sugar transport system ATPase subunit
MEYLGSVAPACACRALGRIGAGLSVGIGSMRKTVETPSGDQRQRVAVARSAAFAQHVIIMDEPTAALGVKESLQVLDPHPPRARPRARRDPDEP